MNKIFTKSILEIVKFALKNKIKILDDSIWNLSSKEILKIKNTPIFKDLQNKKSFFEKANIIMNNFEDELNGIPQKFLNKENIISNGIVFTPVYLANMVVELCKKNIDTNKINLAGDVCSGMGAFIYAINRNIPSVKTLSIEKDSLLYDFSSILFLNKQNSILNADTLSLDASYNNKFDLIVGNPPYVRLQNIDENIKKKIENDPIFKNYLFGSYDISIVFIIKIIELLKPGGIAGLILTRKILSSAYGKKICELLYKKTKIIEIIDFGDNQLFEDKTTYTSILIFQKIDNTVEYGFDYSKVPTSNEINSTNIMQKIDDNKIILKSSVLRKHPWTFISIDEQNILRKIKNKGIPLSNFFDCVQGFRTGDNNNFFIEESGPLSRPYIDGKSIGKGFIKSSKNILWPYCKQNNYYSIIDKATIIKFNKNAYNKLLKSKKKKDQNTPIYAYSRPQNLYAMDLRKIFVKEMMPRAEFAADIKGDICFGSGYALIPKLDTADIELEAWSYILSTDVMEYQYRLLGTNLHSGWFRLYKDHVCKVYLPKINFHDNQFISIIHLLKNNIYNEQHWNKLNDYIFNCFDFNYEEIKQIASYLEKFHKFSIKAKTTGGTKQKMKTSIDNIDESAYPELSKEERKLYYPVELTQYNKFHVNDIKYHSLVTFKNDKNFPIQRWYKYTQGYSTLLVAELINELQLDKHDIIFDPFCGSGTTLLEAKNEGFPSIGCDVSPLSCWISKIKTYSWTKKNMSNLSKAIQSLQCGYNYNYTNLQFKKFFEKAFYPEILAQTIHIINWIAELTVLSEIEKDFLRLALVSIQEEISLIRKHGSHYRFLNDETHVGVNKLNISLIDENSDITKIFKEKVKDMLDDMQLVNDKKNIKTIVECANILNFSKKIRVNAVITSPPYLNRNNYFSQQKAELSLLNLINSNDEYVDLVKQSLCSHVEANLPLKPICKVSEVNTIIEAINKRESNNAKIPHMVAGYFNDIDKLFNRLPNMLQKGAKIAFVVANCRWNGVVIPVDHLICKISEQYGFNVEKIIIARMKGNSPQQMHAYGKIPVRESIVFLSYK